MGEVHRLILAHGRDKARDMVPASQRRLVDVAAEVMAEDAQSLGITYSGWCLTALPHKRLPDDQPWSRSGYRCTLLLEPGRLQFGRGKPVLFGVPYGARARLILLYLQTEAVRLESREVSLGRSMRDWMARMGLSVGGETARGLRDQAHRIAASSIKFFWESETEAATGMARGNIVEQSLFFGEVARVGEASLLEDRVVLGEMFYREIMEHGVPPVEPGDPRAARPLDGDRCLCLARLQAARAAGADAAALASALCPVRRRLRHHQKFPPLLPGCAGSGDGDLSGRAGDAGRGGDRAVSLATADPLSGHGTGKPDPGWLTSTGWPLDRD